MTKKKRLRWSLRSSLKFLLKLRKPNKEVDLRKVDTLVVIKTASGREEQVVHRKVVEAAVEAKDTIRREKIKSELFNDKVRM
jgi:hypothetical protein